MLLLLLATGTAVPLGKRNTQLLDSAEKRGFMNAKVPCRGQSIEGISFECATDSLDIENIMRRPRIATRDGFRFPIRQFSG